jgi:hypothetical protein
MGDAVTAYEAMNMAEAAVEQIWQRRWGKLVFPGTYAFEDEGVYVFGYNTKGWSGRGPRFDYPGVFVPVINKRDGTLQLEPSGPEFFRRHPDLTEVPWHRLAPPLTWDTSAPERVGLGGRPIRPHEGLLIARSFVEQSWKRKRGNLIMPDRYACEFDEFYAFGYSGDRDSDPGIRVVPTILTRKCDGAVHVFMHPLPLALNFPGQEREIPLDRLEDP